MYNPRNTHRENAMSPGAIRFLGISALLLSTTSTVFAGESDSLKDESQIRQARGAFNQAIREQDLDAIEQFSAPEYHIITGRSAQFHGKDKVRGLWEPYFTNSAGICQRDIRELRVNSEWGLAEELGDWDCYSSDGNEPVHASGVYAAKWQRSVSDQWLIQSEVFTTMDCKGPAANCKPPDSIE